MSDTERKAISWDIDGVLVRRIRFQHQAIRPRIPTRILLAPPSIPVIDRDDCNNQTPGLLDTLLRIWHVTRALNPLAIETLGKSQQAGFDNYLNTGRPFTFDWLRMTEDQLAPLKPFVNDVFFCPNHLGVKTSVSKIEAIARLLERYPRVAHIDDNPFDALPAADYFKDRLQVFLVKDRSTRWILRGRKMARYQNVTLINNLTELSDLFDN